MNTRFGIAVICVALLAASALSARAQTLALTNADVIRMVQSGLGNETMIAAIAADPHNFDLSANGLISLRKAGVSDSVIQAMMGAKSNVPDVAFVDGATRLKIDASPTAVLGTSSAHSPIASELVQTAAAEGLSLLHGPLTNVVGNLLTGIVGNLERPRTAAGVSGQWAIPSLVAAHILAKPMPAFDVRYDPATGDGSFAQIVRMTPGSGDMRVIRLDQPVATAVEVLGRGHLRITTRAPLASGEYAIVLSAVPNSVWDFGIR